MRRHGFTLIELLVVIAILGILAGMLMPVFSRARETSKKAVCLANLKNIGTALMMYTSDWDGRLPYQSFLSRYHEVYAVEMGLWDQCNPDPVTGYDPPYHYWDEALSEYITNPEIWYCPTVDKDEKVGNPVSSSYTILTFRENHGTYACLYATPPRSIGFTKPRVQISGGLLESFYDPAKVSLVWDLRHWGVPNSHRVRPPHFGGINVLFADGHERWVPNIENQVTKTNYYTGRAWVGLYPPEY